MLSKKCKYARMFCANETVQPRNGGYVRTDIRLVRLKIHMAIYFCSMQFQCENLQAEIFKIEI